MMRRECAMAASAARLDYRRSNKMKMKFHIPDFLTHWDLNTALIDLINEHPEYFHDGIEIASCYGCFAPALWNGGRALMGYTNRDMVIAIIKSFNDRNVPIRYTFTNPTVTEKDLRDPFCNKLCQLAENGFNEIICNVPVLEEYVRKRYPKYPLISSTCKQIEDYDRLMEEFQKDYKLVVLDYNWNNDFEKLAKIPEEYRSRCEILINPYCMPHCKRRGEHYRALGESQRKASKNPVPDENIDVLSASKDFGCNNPSFSFEEIQQYSTFVSNDSVKRYMELGFNNFKIEGRVLKWENVISSYVYYMAKPEYAEAVKTALSEVKPLQTLLNLPRTCLAQGKQR